MSTTFEALCPEVGSTLRREIAELGKAGNTRLERMKPMCIKNRIGYLTLNRSMEEVKQAVKRMKTGEPRTRAIFQKRSGKEFKKRQQQVSQGDQCNPQD